jgi:hypothetical protein
VFRLITDAITAVVGAPFRRIGHDYDHAHVAEDGECKMLSPFDCLCCGRICTADETSSLNPGGDEERPESTSQDSGRPTSELLDEAAWHLAAAGSELGAEAGLANELRARAEIFRAIEE